MKLNRPNTDNTGFIPVNPGQHTVQVVQAAHMPGRTHITDERGNKTELEEPMAPAIFVKSVVVIPDPNPTSRVAGGKTIPAPKTEVGATCGRYVPILDRAREGLSPDFVRLYEQAGLDELIDAFIEGAEKAGDDISKLPAIDAEVLIGHCFTVRHTEWNNRTSPFWRTASHIDPDTMPEGVKLTYEQTPLGSAPSDDVIKASREAADKDREAALARKSESSSTADETEKDPIPF